MKQDNELGLRISAKYNRIYIHRTTLKAMGDPAFVSLGIHPQSKKLVVLAAREATADALRVRCWEDNSFCMGDYGSALQAFALQTYLKKRRISVEDH